MTYSIQEKGKSVKSGDGEDRRSCAAGDGSFERVWSW